jgi:hypothetical protein
MRSLIPFLAACCLVSAPSDVPLMRDPGSHYDRDVTGTIANPFVGLRTEIAVEADWSKSWQQFPYITSTPDRHFKIRVNEPGFYWVLAKVSLPKGEIRGACLLQVPEQGDPKWLSLPRLKVSNKWGGKASNACPTQGITLLDGPARNRLSYAGISR